MDKYMKYNRDLWNELTPIHEKSDSYNLEGFKTGESRLKSIELAELGDVSGKSMLHLQCHFGLDTLSWARLGANVTGVDFSDKAIALAQSLSSELNIPAKFICSNIYELPDKLQDKFDIVFTSYGVLAWLPDITEWAKIIAHFLKPGGIFYIVEFHPFIYVFENEKDNTDLIVSYSYFHKGKPMRWEPDGSYADRQAKVMHPSYEWTHNLADIINALISASLRIEFLHEFPYCVDDCFPFMERGEDGWWRLTKKDNTIPLTFSLKAVKNSSMG